MSSVGWLLWAVFVVAWPALVAGQGGFATGCSEPNVFLQWFKTVQPDAVLSTLNTSRPTGGWEVCDNTWGTGGTCCDVANLKAGYQKVMAPYKETWDQFILGLKKFKDVSQKLKQVAGGSAAGLKYEQAKKYQYTTVQGESFTAAQAQEIMDKLDSLESDLSAFRESAAGCFTATQRAITSIFCRGCQSGESFLYIPYAGEFFFLKSGSSDFVLKACLPVWHLMFNLQAQMLIGFEVKQMEAGTKEQFKYRTRFPFTSVESEYYAALIACYQAQGDPSTGCSQSMADGISSLFVLYKGPSNLSLPALSEHLLALQQSQDPKKRLLQGSAQGSTAIPENTPRTGTALLPPPEQPEIAIDLSLEQKIISTEIKVDASYAGLEVPTTPAATGGTGVSSGKSALLVEVLVSLFGGSLGFWLL